jgi:hypothetical protein
MAVYQPWDGGPDGVSFGEAASKVSFYGAAPIVKPSVTQQATATTTALRADLDGLEAALVALGLISVS